MYPCSTTKERERPVRLGSACANHTQCCTTVTIISGKFAKAEVTCSRRAMGAAAAGMKLWHFDANSSGTEDGQGLGSLNDGKYQLFEEAIYTHFYGWCCCLVLFLRGHAESESR